jgi:MFS family permease
MAYGVTLPLLPALLGIIPGLGVDDVARHTGWLTATYTVGLFLFSPVWGALADRVDRRGIIAFGLAGSGLALWVVDLSRDVVSLYVARGAAGVLAAAVLPAVFACLVDDTAPQQRQRRFAWVATATSVGFLLGPVIGSALRGMAMGLGATRPMADSPFAAVALLSMAAAACMYIVPACRGKRAADGDGRADEPSVRVALLHTGVVVLAITVAEVGLTLVSRDSPVIAPSAMAGYFALCSVTMVVVQLWLYPVLERGMGEPRLVRVAFGAMALGVGLLAWPQKRWVPVAVFLLAGAAVGVLIPALAARVSLAAGARQGWALGRQAAAANLGRQSVLRRRECFMPLLRPCRSCSPPLWWRCCCFGAGAAARLHAHGCTPWRSSPSISAPAR